VPLCAINYDALFRMTKIQVQLVRDSFAKIEPMAIEAGILFYKRFFWSIRSSSPCFAARSSSTDARS
jgi:hypothetical protein